MNEFCATMMMLLLLLESGTLDTEQLVGLNNC